MTIEHTIFTDQIHRNHIYYNNNIITYITIPTKSVSFS